MPQTKSKVADESDHSETIAKAVITIGCVIAVSAGAVYLLSCGPLANPVVDTPLPPITVVEAWRGFLQGATTNATYTSEFVLGRIVSNIQVQLKTTRHIQVRNPIDMEVKYASFVIEKSEHLSFTPAEPRLELFTGSTEDPVQIPLDIMETRNAWNLYLKTPITFSIVYHVSGPKKFRIHVLLPMSGGGMGITWLEGVSTDLFEVEPELDQLITLFGVILAGFGIVTVLADFVTQIYILLVNRRKRQDSTSS